MSCFICNKETFNVVLSYMKDTMEISNEELNRIGLNLLNLNIDSWNTRYKETVPHEKEQFFNHMCINDFDAYCAIKCIDYQSCEVENYEERNKLIEVIKKMTIDNIFKKYNVVENKIRYHEL